MIATQFDPDCFLYVLTFFRTSQDTFYGTGGNPGLFAAQAHLADTIPVSDLSPPAAQNPLLTRQAIIVLREELEYFAIPSAAGDNGIDANGLANSQLIDLKKRCGEKLLHKRSIFTALQRNVNKENNVAEQHLIDMLCMRYLRSLTPSSRVHPQPVALIAKTTGAFVRSSLRGAASPP